MTVCVDCAHTFEIPEQGRYCPRCRSGVLVDATPNPPQEGGEAHERRGHCD